jgi:hypothetical protein
VPFEWVQVNAERLEYRRTDDLKTCVAEVFKRCNAYYEAVAFKAGQRSSRLLLHRGDSPARAMEAVVTYFQNALTQDALRRAQSPLANQEASDRNQIATAIAPGSGDPIARLPR